MQEIDDTLRLGDRDVPRIPRGQPNDGDVIGLIVSAYDGLLSLYARVSSATEGEKSFLARLLGADWNRLSQPVSSLARDLTASPRGGPDAAAEAGADATAEAGAGAAAGGGGEEEWSVPSPEALEEVASRLGELDLGSFLGGVSFVAERFSVCTRLVPNPTTDARVKSLFLQGLDAEDRHLARIDWLREIVADWESE